MKLATKCIHVAQSPDPVTGAVTTPIYQTSTFRQDAPGCSRGFDYTRSNNPNRSQLETVLAELEGASHGAVFASGLAAEHAVLEAHVRVGDEVLVSNDVYGGTHRLLKRVFEKRGVIVRQCDFSDLRAFSESVSSSCRLVWLESPTNPHLHVYDIAEIARVAHAAGSLVVVDNTFATPCLQRPLELGADIVVHSVTKYLSGHLDVLQGAVLARDDAVFQEIRFLQNAIGATPSPFDCWLTLRGLRTLPLRLRQQTESASRLAEFLQGHVSVRRVFYPGLPSHPGHETAKRQMAGFGAMLSFELDASEGAISDFLSNRRFFTLAESLGGVRSLVCQPATMTHASLTEQARRSAGLTTKLVRISAGCEDTADLISDLGEGLERLIATERARDRQPVARN